MQARFQWSVGARIGVLALSLTCGRQTAAAEELDDETEASLCGPLRDVRTSAGHIDYRLKDSSPVVQKGVDDLDHYHVNLAVDELKTGSHYRSIKDNLDFALRHSPNHQVALQTLVRYDREGGKTWDFPETKCYLYWAQIFAPDDWAVWIVGGYYFWAKNNIARAERWYRQALELNPDSADAHYNLGLLYVQLSEYDKALVHAHAAYAAGYPLPGLRNKLERAGKWKDAPPADPTVQERDR
jgi:tetratricopeptide (TPR) repeat protein